MPEFDLSKLRSGKYGLRESFEEFCCQLFRRTEGKDGWRYRRISGAGGDGGVEAVWEKADGTVWGLQAKYFFKLENSEKGQMKESLDQAMANYGSLTHYTYCLPLTLTGKKGGKAKKPTKGQHERFSEWRDEWIAEYAKTGRKIEIDFWDETDLLNRLTNIDLNGGMLRYWFDRDYFSEQWFASNLADAEAQAGNRYTPTLSLKTPLSSSLETFGQTEAWDRKIKKSYEILAKEINWWESVFTGNSRGITEQLAGELVEQAKEVGSKSKSLLSALHQIINAPETVNSTSFLSEVQSALITARSLEPKVKESLEKKHGANADSKGFRQFSAEYMASFPMAPLDHLRDLIRAINKIRQLETDILFAPALLVNGPAGIGKTHGVIDAAKARAGCGLYSCVIFGEDFSDGEPWIRIAQKLGLNETGREQLLEILDAAGEVTGRPLVIFIDALNETSPDRKRWKAWLPPMIEQVRRYSFVKICVTCRDTYLRDVFLTPITLPQVNHNGFADRIYDAIYQFFQHYGLGLPTGPLLQDEFSNPLFLHLICGALKDAGQNALPSGFGGFLDVVKLLLREKNRRVARQCDYDPRENLVHKAVLAIAALMAKNNTRQIPLYEVNKVAEEIIPRSNHSQSLVNILEKESLLSIVENQGQGFGSDPSFFVRFTFERISDHFIVEHLLSGMTVDDISESMRRDGNLHFMVKDNISAQEFAGLLEAASILLVEKFNRELPSFSVDLDFIHIIKPFISALQWRTPASISNETIYYTERALQDIESSNYAIDALLKISIRKNHPLNARYMYGFWNRLPRLVRDPILFYILEKNYSGWSEDVDLSSASAILIEWSLRAPLNGIDTEVATLWGSTFAWFLASPNRRIRDKASKGLVRIAIAQPEMLPPLLKMFLLSDDEYIVERILVATYGALLLNPSPESVEAVASVVAGWFAPLSKEGPPTANVIIRDHARSIIELAYDMGVAPEYLSPDLFRPPYSSDWPIQFPSKEDVSEFVNNADKYPSLNLAEASGLASGTDFARYIITPRLVREFDCKSAGIEPVDIYRWFLAEVVLMGYPGPADRCAKFDKMVLAHFGGGRGRAGWAERLGKKYGPSGFTVGRQFG